MATGNALIEEKLEQVPRILEELGLDAWLLFARESATVHDPSFDLVVGTNVTWHSAFILTRKGDRIAIVGSLDKANLASHGHYPEIVTYVGGVTEDLRKALSRLDPKRIAINYSVNDSVADGMTHGMWLTLTGILASTPYADRLETSDRLVAALQALCPGLLALTGAVDNVWFLSFLTARADVRKLDNATVYEISRRYLSFLSKNQIEKVQVGARRRRKLERAGDECFKKKNSRGRFHPPPPVGCYLADLCALANE